MRTSWWGTDGTEEPLAQGGCSGAGGGSTLWESRTFLLMTLTSEQVSELLTAHCYRVIDNMSSDDLFSYAMQMMIQSFDQNPGQSDTDIAMLIEDIWVAEGEDEDSTQEFIAGVVGNDLAEETMKTTQF
jgi:hypothetical protein